MFESTLHTSSKRWCRAPIRPENTLLKEKIQLDYRWLYKIHQAINILQLIIKIRDKQFKEDKKHHLRLIILALPELFIQRALYGICIFRYHNRTTNFFILSRMGLLTSFRCIPLVRKKYLEKDQWTEVDQANHMIVRVKHHIEACSIRSFQDDYEVEW